MVMPKLRQWILKLERVPKLIRYDKTNTIHIFLQALNLGSTLGTLGVNKVSQNHKHYKDVKMFV